DPVFLLSNIDANIAGPAGNPMFLHADQSFMPDPWPAYAMVANVIWMLDDFTPENGATRIVPGSHKLCRQPDFTKASEWPEITRPVTAPAGTAMALDGRLWHQTGANVTRDQRRFGILSYREQAREEGTPWPLRGCAWPQTIERARPGEVPGVWGAPRRGRARLVVPLRGIAERAGGGRRRLRRLSFCRHSFADARAVPS